MTPKTPGAPGTLLCAERPMPRQITTTLELPQHGTVSVVELWLHGDTTAPPPKPARVCARECNDVSWEDEDARNYSPKSIEIPDWLKEKDLEEMESTEAGRTDLACLKARIHERMVWWRVAINMAEESGSKEMSSLADALLEATCQGTHTFRNGRCVFCYWNG